MKGTDCKGKPGTLDFNAGQYSQFGGNLVMDLYDNGTFRVELIDPKTLKTISKTVTCSGVRDFVLGVGETQKPKIQKKKAKLWGLIPVKTYHIVKGFEEQSWSLHGRYRGNSDNNTFFAIQGNDTTNNRFCKADDVWRKHAEIVFNVSYYRYNLQTKRLMSYRLKTIRNRDYTIVFRPYKQNTLINLNIINKV